MTRETYIQIVCTDEEKKDLTFAYEVLERVQNQCACAKKEKEKDILIEARGILACILNGDSF